MNIVVIAHNIRSAHNVGSLFRTCDGFGVEKLYLTGYTPYPMQSGDTRLPHLAQSITRRIHKTALGAEESVPFTYSENIDDILKMLRKKGYRIVGLEQNERSIPLNRYKPPQKVALLLGEEVAGIHESLIAVCDDLVEIPMHGKKESFNVTIACAITLYAFLYS